MKICTSTSTKRVKGYHNSLTENRVVFIYIQNTCRKIRFHAHSASAAESAVQNISRKVQPMPMPKPPFNPFSSLIGGRILNSKGHRTWTWDLGL
jgi:hypothetical protein